MKPSTSDRAPVAEQSWLPAAEQREHLLLVRVTQILRVGQDTLLAPLGWKQELGSNLATPVLPARLPSFTTNTQP